MASRLTAAFVSSQNVARFTNQLERKTSEFEITIRNFLDGPHGSHAVARADYV
jgi:hypothetical protein